MDRFPATTRAAVAMTAVGSSVAAASLLTDYPVMAGQAARYALAPLVLFMWTRAAHVQLPRPTVRELGWLAAVAFVGMGGFNVVLIAATARTDPSLVGAIVGTAPVALAVLGARIVGDLPPSCSPEPSSWRWAQPWSGRLG
jgi:drug/metabolite transporter (DMT)-like permease